MSFKIDFLGPENGIQYTEGFVINSDAQPTDLDDVTKGKGIIIHRMYGKAQILWFDSGIIPENSIYNRPPWCDLVEKPTKVNPHWIAPSRWFIALLFNGGQNNLVGNIDLINSDLVFGSNEEVNIAIKFNKKIPFTKEGTRIVHLSLP